MQQTHWSPIISRLNERYDLNIKTTTGIVKIKQDEHVINKLKAIISSFDNVKLAAFEKVVLRSKSFFIALALLENEISVNEAALATRLEVIQQIKLWGEVEDSHDVDREELTLQLSAARCAIIKE